MAGAGMGDCGADDLDSMVPSNCPSPFFDTWDRHNSIAFSATKGLRNAPGENNCFVNCAVQVFWHLDVFRRSYRRLLGHTCMGNSCIFCALKVIFTQFQYSDKSSLHPDALRKALAETFANQQRFQLGHMDDAAECFENILRRIHFHIACNHNEDACTAPHCLPHQKFSMVVYEKVVCPCGASSSPLKFSEMVHYVSASALVSQSRMMQENGDALHPDRFGLLLRKAGSMGDVRDCPASCGKQVQKQRTLLNIPDVVSVGLVWDSDHPSMETTTEVAAALGTAILLQDMYHRVMPDVRKLPRLQLVAVVCYYGKHYSTFVFHSKLQTWVYFDDATVREIGPQWENVVERCSRGRFQPLLLLYANPSASPVSVETAPRKRVMAPGYAQVGVTEVPEGANLDRTHENLKLNVSRSTTPTPKLTQPSVNQGGYPGAQLPEASPSQDTGRDSPARLSREHSRQPSFLFAINGKNDKNRAEGTDEVDHASVHPNARRQLLDGGANANALETMAEDAEDYADYTLSGGDQYRRPTLSGADSINQLPLPPNTSRYPDAQRRDSFTKRANSKEKAGVDVVRYQLDPRGNSHGPELSYPEGFSCQKGEKVGHKPPTMTRGRQRSLSSGIEDEGVDVSNASQHVVVKPKATAQHANYQPADAFPHSAVQSGLATLPRHGKGANNDPANHQRVTSTNQEVAQLTRKGHRQCTAVDPPLPPGTPPPEYSTDSQALHSRQTSQSSMKNAVSMGHIDQLAAASSSSSSSSSNTKKSESGVEKVKKKIKKEKKSEKDSSKKSDKKKSKSDLKKSESEGDLSGGGGGDKKNSLYIDRRMVENILKHQGVHRQNSSCSNNSASSVDSDSLMGKLLASKANSNNLTLDIPFDNMSLGSQKDSGYGSSDRNSSSSTGSGTVDPYTQYFISKSMVVPRSVNTQHLEQQNQYTATNNKHDNHLYNPPPSSHPPGVVREDGRLIMHPIKESSQEDVLHLSPSEPLGTQKFIVANTTTAPVAGSEAKVPPVPPKNFAQFQIIKSSNSQTAANTTHERDSSLDSLDKDESISNHFVSLCKKADVLMDNCMLAETTDDISTALYYCEQALGCLKEAMAVKELTSKALTYVQKKHNSCLLKTRTLQKRSSVSRQEPHPTPPTTDIPSTVGNRSSVTSSDSDMSDQLCKQLRPDSRGNAHPPRRSPHPSQDSSSGGFSGIHDRQHSASRTEKSYDRQQSNFRGDNVHDRQQSGSRVESLHDRQHSNSRAETVHPRGENVHDRQHSSSRAETVHPRGENVHDRQLSGSRAESVHDRQSSGSRQGLERSGRQAQRMEGRSSGGGVRRESSVPREQRTDCGPIHHRMHSGGAPALPHSHSANYLQAGTNSSSAGPDMYGSLPRSNKPRRSLGDPNPEVYQSFLSTQKNLHAEVSCSQQSLDSLKSDSSSSEHSAGSSAHRKLDPRYVQDSQRQRSGGVPQFAAQQPAMSVPYSHQQDARLASGLPPSQRSVSGHSGPHNVVTGQSSWQQQQQHHHHQLHPAHPAYSHHQTVSPSHPYPSHPKQQPPPSEGFHHHPPAQIPSRGPGLPLPSHPPQSAPPPPPSKVPHPQPPPPPSGRRVVQGTSVSSHHESTDEHPSTADNSSDSQKPHSITADVGSDTEGAAAVSVRALASRFETTGLAGSRPCSRQGSMKSTNQPHPLGGSGVHRVRSKSESFSRKPKSVLKNKKNKNRPRKSVTFADSSAMCTGLDDLNSGYESARELSSPRVAMDDRAYYSDDDERRGGFQLSHSDNELDDCEDTGSSNSDDMPLTGDDACQLCHKRRNERGKLFCEKCSFYMSKLNLC